MPLLPKSLSPSGPPAQTRTAGLFFATHEQRVALAREMFFDEGQRPSGLVPELVIQSWMRCTVANRRPSEPLHLEPVTKARMASALARNRLLLQAASCTRPARCSSPTSSARWASTSASSHCKASPR